jgi:hypothetical protein
VSVIRDPKKLMHHLFKAFNECPAENYYSNKIEKSGAV